VSFLSNPILSREVDHRMRDNRTYFIPMVYILVLGFVTLGAYLVMVEIGDTPYQVFEGWITGKVIFHLIAFTQMTLILLLVPSVSAGAITSERDKGTLPLLLVTPLARGKISAGKLVAPVLYVLLLVSTSIPFAALSFGFGGTDLKLLGWTYGCLVMTALFTASMGLLISTVMRRTVPAVLLAYGLVAALVVGSGVAELALHIFWQDLETIWFAYLNPYTPLILHIYTEMDEMPGRIYWWITPLVQFWLGAFCLAIAAVRIHSMRD
jgi:ABC-type transport system involved in multi-copper enzyme maturation permease subunit